MGGNTRGDEGMGRPAREWEEDRVEDADEQAIGGWQVRWRGRPPGVNCLTSEVGR